MKTVNGKNKLERQINKAKKYVGLTLKEASNKYLEIVDIEDKENTYIILRNFDNVKLVKNGDLFVITPLNWNEEKPIFVNEFLTVHEEDSYYNGSYVIFKSQNPALKEIIKGYDDVYKLADFIKEKGFFQIRKK